MYCYVKTKIFMSDNPDKLDFNPRSTNYLYDLELLFLNLSEPQVLFLATKWK